MDAKAGIAIGSRRRLGRVEHVGTVFLLVQATVTEGKISLGKNSPKEVLAGLLTKHVDAATMLQRCCNDAELRGWIGNEMSIRREQADFESK